MKAQLKKLATLGLPPTTAFVLVAMIAAVTVAYVLVPDHRTEIVGGIAVLGGTLLAYLQGSQRG